MLLHCSTPDSTGVPTFTNQVCLMFVAGRMGIRRVRLSLREGSGPDRHSPSPRCTGGRGRLDSVPIVIHPRSQNRCSIADAAFSRPNSGRNCDAVHKLSVLPDAQHYLDWLVCRVFGSPTISPAMHLALSFVDSSLLTNAHIRMGEIDFQANFAEGLQIDEAVAALAPATVIRRMLSPEEVHELRDYLGLIPRRPAAASVK